jgi:hypothetical protein
MWRQAVETSSGRLRMASRYRACLHIDFISSDEVLVLSIVASAQKNIAKIGGLFKRKSSTSKDVASNKVQVASSTDTLDRKTSNSSSNGFQKLPED